MKLESQMERGLTMLRDLLSPRFSIVNTCDSSRETRGNRFLPFGRTWRFVETSCASMFPLCCAHTCIRVDHMVIRVIRTYISRDSETGLRKRMETCSGRVFPACCAHVYSCVFAIRSRVKQTALSRTYKINYRMHTKCMEVAPA